MSPPIRWIKVEKTRTEAQFFAFVRERLKILERRSAGSSAPWTSDPVLRRYHFTNIKAPEVHQQRFERLAVRAKLTQMECENALCEFSKYVRLMDGRTKSARKFTWADRG